MSSAPSRTISFEPHPAQHPGPGIELPLLHRWVILSARSDWRLGASRRDVYRHQLARLLAASASVPLARTVAVVQELDSPWWSPVLAFLPRENVVEQPLDRGTATGVALALAKVRARAPSAEVVIATLAADPEQLSGLVERADLFDGEADGRLACTYEGEELASCAGRVRDLVRRFGERQPTLIGSMNALVAGGGPAQRDLDALYPFLPSLDLARDVLDAPADDDDAALHHA